MIVGAEPWPNLQDLNSPFLQDTQSGIAPQTTRRPDGVLFIVSLGRKPSLYI